MARAQRIETDDMAHRTQGASRGGNRLQGVAAKGMDAGATKFLVGSASEPDLQAGRLFRGQGEFVPYCFLLRARALITPHPDGQYDTDVVTKRAGYSIEETSRASPTIAGKPHVNEVVVGKFIQAWKTTGFLH